MEGSEGPDDDAAAAAPGSTSSTADCGVASVPTPPSSQKDLTPSIDLQYKWCGQTYRIQVPADATVSQLKNEIFLQVRVQPHRQKIVGLCRVRVPRDDERVFDLICGRLSGQFLLFGAVEEEIVHQLDPSLIPPMSNELDQDYVPCAGDVEADTEVQRQISQRVADIELTFIVPARKGRKLLVLDLDYTLFDVRGISDQLRDLCRPYLHDFLTAVYREYDICVWSQTHWRYLEMKLTEMGCLTHPDYRITFVLDVSAMFRVRSRHRGQDREHYVKPLEYIWRKAPELYGPHNTVHVDDLARNFALNPRNGLQVRQWKYTPFARLHDRELQFLARYLLLVAPLEDVRALDHRQSPATGGGIGPGSAPPGSRPASAFLPTAQSLKRAADAPLAPQPPPAVRTAATVPNVAGVLHAGLPPGVPAVPGAVSGVPSAAPPAGMVAATRMPVAADGSDPCTIKCRTIISQLKDFRELMEQLRERFEQHPKLVQRLTQGIELVKNDPSTRTFSQADLLSLRAAELLILACVRPHVERLVKVGESAADPVRAWEDRMRLWGRREFRALVRYMVEHTHTNRDKLVQMYELITRPPPDIPAALVSLVGLERLLLEAVRVRHHDLQAMVGAVDHDSTLAGAAAVPAAAAAPPPATVPAAAAAPAAAPAPVVAPVVAPAPQPGAAGAVGPGRSAPLRKLPLELPTELKEAPAARRAEMQQLLLATLRTL